MKLVFVDAIHDIITLSKGKRFTYAILFKDDQYESSVRPYTDPNIAGDADVAFLEKVSSYDEAVAACQKWEDNTQF